MTFQTAEQMQDKINILEGAVSALEDAIVAQAMSMKLLEVAAAQEERIKIVAWLKGERKNYAAITGYARLINIICKPIKTGDYLK